MNIFPASKTEAERAEAVVDALRGFEIGDAVIVIHPNVKSGTQGTILSKNYGVTVVLLPGDRTVHGLLDEHLRHAD